MDLPDGARPEDEAGSWVERTAPLSAVDELGDAAIRTAVRRLPWLERLVSVPVWGKFECQQHTGSFKYRGAYVAMVRGARDSVVAASTGNHGLAVAEAAHRLGRTANICVPVVASRLRRERVLVTGAGLIEHGRSLAEATRHARALAESHGIQYISSYNDPGVVAGAATLALEFLADVPTLTTLVAPVGGGGLISGLGVGAAAVGADLELIGCEPERYASVGPGPGPGTGPGAGSGSRSGARRVGRGAHPPTLADGLEVDLEPGSITYPMVRRYVSGMLTLSEEELAAAALALLVHESVLVEPAGAAGVVACLRLAQQGRLTGPVGIPLCGGNIAHTTLSRVQRFAFQDPDLLRLLDPGGGTATGKPAPVSHPGAPAGRPATRQPATRAGAWAGAEVGVEAEVGPGARGGAWAVADPDPSSPVADLVSQLDGCRQRLADAKEHVDEYVGYCHRHELVFDEGLCERLGQTVDDALERVGLHWSAPEHAKDRFDWLAEGEAVLRFGLATRAYVRGALEWCSPSYERSRMTRFLGTGERESPAREARQAPEAREARQAPETREAREEGEPDREREPSARDVAWDDGREESASVRRVESQLLDVLGLAPGRCGLTVTSSRMAAYTLVESFLLRERLRPGDGILLAPFLHSEVAGQLTALPFVRCTRTSGHGTEDILADVARHRPRVLFVDPVSHTAQQRMTDVVGLLEALRGLPGEPLTVVVDGTMVTGALPARALTGDGRVEVLYYESCAKYLQLGPEGGMAGLVVYPAGVRPYLERQRRNTGTLLYRNHADLFPCFDRDLFGRRMSRIRGNAREIAERLDAEPGVRKAGTVFHPALPGHPDASVAARMPYAGGCVTFRFHEAARNHRDALEPLVDRVLVAARSAGLHLTGGAGFGFSAPRVSAAASTAESEPPFLRLYAGDRPGAHGAQLADLLAEAVRTR